MSTNGRPGTEVNAAWDSPAVGNIDDNVTTPTAGDGYVAVADNKDDNAEQIYGGFTWDADLATTYSSITSIKWHVRCKDDGGYDLTLDARIKINGSWTSAQQITYTGSFAAYELEFTGSWSPAHVAACEVGNLIGSNPELNVDWLYLEVDGVLAGSGAGCSFVVANQFFADSAQEELEF